MSNKYVDLLAWSSSTEISGQDVVKCCPHLSTWLVVGECGHTKATRAAKIKQKQWQWDSVYQTTFENVKTTITKDDVLAYPDHTQEFEVYTDSSKFQLGAVITQNNRPLACRKLNKAQQRNSMTKQELLVTVFYGGRQTSQGDRDGDGWGQTS